MYLVHVRCFNKIMVAGRLIHENEPDGIYWFRNVSVNNHTGRSP
jgi:hypothetical protein